MKNLSVLILVLLLAQPLLAQQRFSFELRGGVSFATQELGNADLKTGFGFEGILDYQIVKPLGVYAGWGWNQFVADESFAGAETTFEETGYLFGLELNQPIINESLSFYLRAGGIYNHIELENKAGDITADTGHGLGWQVGAGLDIGLGSNWELRPGVKYQSLSREVTLETIKTDLDLQYFSIGVGIAKRF